MGYHKKIMSGTGTNFVSDKFRKFCSRLKFKQAVPSAYHHQSNGQVKACIKFIKCTLKCTDTGGDIHMALLQIHTTPLGQGLLSLETLIFNCPVCRVMPVLDRKPIGRDNDDEHHSKLVHRQYKSDTYNDASPIFASIPIGSTVAVQQEDHGQLLGKETTMTMTYHTQYNSQQLAGESHATDDISSQHP